MPSSQAQPHNYFHIRLPFMIMLIVVVILTIYYPSISGDICKLDDVDLYNSLMATKAMNFGDYLGMFIPTTSGIYYRPLLMTTFYMDRFFINLDTGFMKLENILLHLVNALLVYWLANQLLPDDKKGRSFIPLISAFFFGVHPVNTESVNWISGRTDVLACVFVLLSANFLIKFKYTGGIRFLVLSAFSMLLGYLSKEASLAFFPGALLILYSGNRQGKEIISNYAPLSSGGDGRKAFFSIFAASAAALFLAYRYVASTSTDDKFGFTLKIIFSDIPYSTAVVLNALAFYLRKIIFPFPLNFAIIEPDPLHDFLGLPAVILCFYLISKRDTISALFVTGVLLIAPAFLISFKQIAWTPYAERYVYMASSFIIPSLVFYGVELSARIEQREMAKKLAVAVLLIIAVAGTVQRNFIWRHNVTLFRDTVEKSPFYSQTRALYGFSLAEQGDLAEARNQFNYAREREEGRTVFSSAPAFVNDVLGYWEGADFGFAYLLEREGKFDKAAEAYERIIERSNGQSPKAVKRLIPLYIDMLRKGNNADRMNAKKKLYLYSEKKYNYTNAYAMYLVGRILLFRGDRSGASDFFSRSHDMFGDSDDFKTITKKLLKRSGCKRDHAIYKTS